MPRFASARQAILGGALFATAAVLGLTGWLALVAAAIAGIASALPLRVSALIIGVALILWAGARPRPAGPGRTAADDDSRERPAS